jgi:uncharacterized repeat protein (TIGR01451 family)
VAFRRVALVGLLGFSFAGVAHGAVPSVGTIMAACPTAAEIAAVNSDLRVTFEGDPTAGTLACRASSGSQDLSPLQERVYQALLAMKAMQFAVPLPWTALPLYAWFVHAIDGVRFRNDISLSYCCDPPGVIDIQTQNLSAVQTGAGVGALIAGLAHEARHNEIGGHTCGTNDATFDEDGAWAIETYTLLWEAMYTGPFLNVSAPYPAYAREADYYLAQSLLSTRFCSIPQADLSVAASATPAQVRRGEPVTYSITVSNAGPGVPSQTWVALELPKYATFRSASAGCIDVASAQVTCAVGSLAAGATANIQVVLTASGPVGSEIETRRTPFADGIHVVGIASDTQLGNNKTDATVAIVDTATASLSGGPLTVGPAHAGSVFTVSFIVRDGVGRLLGTAARITCDLTLGPRTLPWIPRAGNPERCTWPLPRSVQRNVLHGDIVVTLNSVSIRRSFSVRVH